MSTTEQFKINIEKAISSVLQKNIEEEFDRLKKDLISKLESRKNEIVSGILLGLVKQINFNTAGDSLIVTIREIKDK